MLRGIIHVGMTVAKRRRVRQARGVAVRPDKIVSCTGRMHQQAPAGSHPFILIYSVMALPMTVTAGADYCDYPPQLAEDVEIAEQRDGERLIYVVGAASVARYLMLRETEYKVLQLLGEALTPGEICAEFKNRYGGTLPPATLAKFITRLDEAGIIAGERGLSGHSKKDQQLTRQPYLRFSLFNPDRLFARMVPMLRWIWTPEFVTFTVLMMLSTLLLTLLHWPEVSA